MLVDLRKRSGLRTIASGSNQSRTDDRGRMHGKRKGKTYRVLRLPFDFSRDGLPFETVFVSVLVDVSKEGALAGGVVLGQNEVHIIPASLVSVGEPR